MSNPKPGLALGLAAALALAALAAPAAAQPPTITIDDVGAHVITFTTPGIYDFSRHYHEEDSGIVYTTETEQDAKGRIRGFGRDLGGDFDVHHVIKGGCKAAGGVTRLKMKMLSYGSIGSGDPKEYQAVGVSRGVVQGSGATAKLVGTLKSRLCIRSEDPIRKRYVRVCNGNTAPYEIDLANQGIWLIKVAFESNGGRLGGFASIATSSANPAKIRTFQVSIDGSIDSDGIATIQFAPVDETGLGSVRVRGPMVYDPVLDVPTLVAIDEVKGRLLGQRFDVTY
jgi:hypothetical protein